MHLSKTQANKILVLIFLFLQGMNSLTEGAGVSRFIGAHTLTNTSIFKTYSHICILYYMCIRGHAFVVYIYIYAHTQIKVQ